MMMLVCGLRLPSGSLGGAGACAPGLYSSNHMTDCGAPSNDAVPGGIMPLEVDVPVRPIFTSPLDAVRPAGVTEADSIAVALMAKPMVGPLPTRGVGGGSASGAGGAGGAGGSAAMDM
eukprot:c10528_g1_i1.p2 GENE.c10528_g1_i1~~c10528_g1_i1.p2  ORF type:complete len:118 (-),score=3.43 c10528_g1_i1:200-553(-)